MVFVYPKFFFFSIRGLQLESHTSAYNPNTHTQTHTPIHTPFIWYPLLRRVLVARFTHFFIELSGNARGAAQTGQAKYEEGAFGHKYRVGFDKQSVCFLTFQQFFPTLLSQVQTFLCIFIIHFVIIDIHS